MPQSSEPALANATDVDSDSDAWDPASFWVKVTLTYNPLTLTLSPTVSPTHALTLIPKHFTASPHPNQGGPQERGAQGGAPAGAHGRGRGGAGARRARVEQHALPLTLTLTLTLTLP